MPRRMRLRSTALYSTPAPTEIQCSAGTRKRNNGFPLAKASRSWKRRVLFREAAAVGERGAHRRDAGAQRGEVVGAVARSAASAAMPGSTTQRVSMMARKRAPTNCSISARVLAKCRPSGIWISGPPPGPDLMRSTPCSSR